MLSACSDYFLAWGAFEKKPLHKLLQTARTLDLSHGGLDPYSVIKAFSTTASSDVRDRVFAVRMMMIDPKCIRVDYRLSPVDLFFEVLDALKPAFPSRHLDYSGRMRSEPLIDSLLEALNLNHTSFERCDWPDWAGRSLRNGLDDLLESKTRALVHQRAGGDRATPRGLGMKVFQERLRRASTTGDTESMKLQDKDLKRIQGSNYGSSAVAKGVFKQQAAPKYTKKTRSPKTRGIGYSYRESPAPRAQTLQSSAQTTQHYGGRHASDTPSQPICQQAHYDPSDPPPPMKHTQLVCLRPTGNREQHSIVIEVEYRDAAGLEEDGRFAAVAEGWLGIRAEKIWEESNLRGTA